MGKNYEEFKNELFTAISNEIEGLTMSRVEKQNGVVLDAMTVKTPGSCAPVMYANDAYERLQNGMSFEAIVQMAKDVFSAGRPTIPELNREMAEKNLVITVMNKAENEDRLLSQGVQYAVLEDLLLVPKLSVQVNVNGSLQSGGILVTKAVCNLIGMTGEEALEFARKNTNEQEFVCMSLTQFMSEQAHIASEMGPEETNSSLWILSNKAMFGGAAMISSDRALKAARKRIGRDFIILPSSVHEILLFPVAENWDADFLKNMVSQVNAECVQPTERLSDSVYFYDGNAVKRVA